MSEKHEGNGGLEEQDVEAHTARATDVDEQTRPADDDDVQAHIKFN